ncbi:23S rRNA (pseudouridine(1915)-N(3))-methyltransferase RlmH [Thermotoga sp. KOL6]|uniref:23S rRNA (pseudouridine(1915)-N(3))-methyltransferase RlmH n=1 Tax=Thermotoga sp. KOL6 TaxID=126741 RepID=UPI000C792ED9|nr:23S rRNA (pseudouridine(1915)-N(3))-methyltransferase RlmH [Thermotoga sp. KOL6]PLV58327.1 50S rRNA methyltransferase [Thermotoga sp. KOL6]
MKIRIVVGGKLDGFVREGLNHYRKFLKRFCRLEVLDVKLSHKGNIEEVVKLGTRELEKRILSNSLIVVLDKRGEQVSSEEFAKFIEDVEMKGKDMTVLIGGPYGLSEELFPKAHRVFSLSKMTFTHGMATLIVLEQLFRAFKITHGETYHY